MVDTRHRNRDFHRLGLPQEPPDRAGAGLKRAALLQAPPSARTCTQCPREFIPNRMGQIVCGPRCAQRAAKQKRTDKAREDRAKLRKRKEAIQTIPELIRLAQIEFNKFIRERDKQAGWPCISSGKQLDWTGNDVDAGHWRSRGAAPQLRFHEDNCHAQSKRENRFSADMSAYRTNLMARIGLERVLALEADNHTHHWTREELRAIRDLYRAKLKALKDKE